MQFITRMLIVLGVLAGLGYGSYAFGKYVLSARLFGPQSNNSVATAAAGTLQAPEVEIVPAPPTTDDADNSDDAGVAPTRAPRAAATPDDRVEIIPSQNDDNSDDDNADSSDDRPRVRPTRRPRRRRRARPTPRPTRRESTTTAPEQAPPARDLNDDPPASNNEDSDNDAPRIDIPTPRDNNPSPAPTRRRERRTAPDVEAPRIETPRREPRSVPAPTRRRESSPVPVPEGALGGRGESSPVPVPE